MAAIIAPSPDADRAIQYLTKYLAKSVADTFTDPDQADAEYVAQVDRLHAELRYLPCSEQCANWLRYGVQPSNAGPGLQAGWCGPKAHDRENLGLGGRRALVSRQWSGKTPREHKADRATVVREALLNAGIVAPEIERLAATVTLPDGRPRFVWTDTRPDSSTYATAILQAVVERLQWREQYDQAKRHAGMPVRQFRPTRTADARPHCFGLPDNCRATPSTDRGGRSSPIPAKGR
ncbi:MAG TPA: replication initiator [Propionibacteriaceae bacterium]|nr:replication initiator [Propionibacteriaceae bacterium]